MANQVINKLESLKKQASGKEYAYFVGSIKVENSANQCVVYAVKEDDEWDELIIFWSQVDNRRIGLIESRYSFNDITRWGFSPGNGLYSLRFEIAGLKEYEIRDVNNFNSKNGGNPNSLDEIVQINRSYFKKKKSQGNLPTEEQIKKGIETSRREQTSILLEEANKLYQTGIYDEAIQSYLQAIETDRGNYQIHYSIAKCYAHLKHFDNAKQSFDKAVKLLADKSEQHKLEKEFSQLLFENGAYKEANDIVSDSLTFSNPSTDEEVSRLIKFGMASGDYNSVQNKISNYYYHYKDGVINALNDAENRQLPALNSTEYKALLENSKKEIKSRSDFYSSRIKEIRKYFTENNFQSTVIKDLESAIDKLKASSTLQETIENQYKCSSLSLALDEEAFEILNKKELVLKQVTDYINKFDFALEHLDNSIINKKFHEILSKLRNDYAYKIKYKHFSNLVPELDNIKSTISECKEMEKLIVGSLLEKAKVKTKKSFNDGKIFIEQCESAFPNTNEFNNFLNEVKSKNTRKTKIIIGIIGGALLFATSFFLISSKVKENKAWKLAQQYDSYKTFIKNYPNSKHLNKAWDSLVEVEWQKILKEEYNSYKIILLENYLEDYTEQFETMPHEKEAFKLLEETRWLKVKESNSIEEIEKFINENPNSDYINEANKYIKETKTNKVNDRKIIPYKKFGAITPNTSEKDLIDIYGLNNITNDKYYVEDYGIGITKIFAGTADEISIFWKDERIKEKPVEILVENLNNSWNLPENINVNSSIKNVYNSNSQDFLLDSFHGYNVVDWKNGRFQGLEVKFMFESEDIDLLNLFSSDSYVPASKLISLGYEDGIVKEIFVKMQK